MALGGSLGVAVGSLAPLQGARGHSARSLPGLRCVCGVWCGRLCAGERVEATEGSTLSQ